MAERTCTIEGCSQKHYGRGLCHRHYDQARNSGTLDEHERTLGPRGVCSVDGCDLLWHSQGFCGTHFMRWKKYGDPLFIGPRGGRWTGSERERSPDSCWCGKPVFARDLCRRHWREDRAAERPDPPAERECKVCGQVKPISEFYTRSDGLPDLVCKVDACLALSRSREGWSDERRAEERRKRARYRAANSEWYRQRYRADRLRKAGVPSTLKREHWLVILAAYGFSCAYCRTSQDDLEGPLEQEHVFPTSRGGCHSVANVVPACRTCNARKHDSTAEEWEFERGGPHLTRRL